MENDDQVDVELDLELGMNVGGTRVNGGEQHVQWDFDVGHHISISHLDVLDLRRIHLILKGLHPDQLNLNRLNQDL